MALSIAAVRLCLMHLNVPSGQFTSIHLGNGRLDCAAVFKVNKAKAAGAVGLAVHGEVDIGYFAEFAKDFTELGFIDGCRGEMECIPVD